MRLAGVFEQTTLAIDNSTQSCAWSLWRGSDLIDFGEVIFKGKNTLERLVNMNEALHDLQTKCQKVDVICIEKTIRVNSQRTAILLGMAAGAVIASIANSSTVVCEVEPSTWQSFIGNKLLTAKEKREIKSNNPGKSLTWLKAEYRRVRKQRTIDFVQQKLGVVVNNDNQSDSIGLGYYKVNQK